MASKWPEVTVGDIADTRKNALVGGPFGSNLVSKDYVPEGVPVIRGQNMGSRQVGGDFVFVTEKKAQSLAANTARPGDLVFTQRGTLGQVALVPHGLYDTYIVSQSQMKLTADPKKADPLFLYYIFSSPEQLAYIDAHAIKVGVPHTNLGILRNTPVILPPLEAQRQIVEILGTLDDKIELNRQINTTLEQLARALFQSWFVDFDPVRAKASGEPADSICRRLGLTPELLALFPAALEDSAMGEVPVGWQVTTVGEHTILVKGRSYKSDELNASDTALVTLKSVQRGGGYRLDGLKGFTGTYKAEQVITPGELIVAMTDVTQAADVVGRPALVFDSGAYTTLIASLDLMIVRPKPETFGTHFLNNLFQTHSFQSHIVGHTNGTTVLHLAKSGLPTYKFVLPSIEITAAFDKYASYNWKLAANNEQEIRTLTTLRDELLPKLLAGDLRLN